MKKGFIIILLVFSISWFTSCEKDVYDINPQMEAYYTESVQLPTVSIDSVTMFKNKVNGYVTTYPQAKEHRRYPKILENIKAASLRLIIVIDTTWAGDTVIHY